MPLEQHTQAVLAFEELVLDVPQRLGSHDFSPARITRFNQTYDALSGAHASPWHIGGGWMRAMIDHRHAAAQKLRETGKYVPEFGPSPGIQNVRWFQAVQGGDSLTFYSTPIARRPVSKAGWGLVSSLNQAVNQHSQLVMAFNAQIFMTLAA